jgi:Ca-activated chloride channel family protein
VTFELGRAEWLSLLLALPVWWWWLRPSARWGVLVARGDEAARVALPHHFASLMEVTPLLWRTVAVGALVVALAEPRLVHTREERLERGVAIAVAIDLSTSMWAQDMAQATTRLQAAKSTARGFLARREVDDVGLVTFAGEAHVRLPLTHDRWVVEEAVDALEVGLLLDGTDIAGAIAVGARLLRDAPQRERMLILVTDGAHNRAGLEPAVAARAASAYGVKIFPIAIGSDEMLRTAVTGMETVLTQAARITGGRYFRATDATALEQIYRELDRLAAGTEEVILRRDVTPIGHWFLLAALLAWVGAGALRASPWGVLP